MFFIFVHSLMSFSDASGEKVKTIGVFLEGRSFSMACSYEIVGLQNGGFPTKIQKDRPNCQRTECREHAC